MRSASSRFFFSVFLLLAFQVPSAQAQENALLPQMLETFKPRCIGPANMSGRIVDVAVYEKEPRIMYVASASGGVWKTMNHGTTFKPVFEREGTSSIGAVAMFQDNPEIVWVGTGEANARNSVSWGDGVYRSTDGGKTWLNTGLKDSAHIGRIVTHPTNPEIAYVAVLGRIWGPSKERGLYKTEDGGKTWENTKLLDENTGFIDVVMDPENPDILYAAAYQVRRDAFSGGNPVVQTGPSAGLFKTVDGGKSWTKLTQGLPNRPFGRCGISIFRNDPRVVYAVVQTDKTVASVQAQGPNKKLELDAGGIFRSDDRGETWTHVNSLCPRPFYFGQIRVDPNFDQRVYVLGIPMLLSTDGGKRFGENNVAKGTHVDYHALWIDPKDSNHLVLGSDGGLYFSWDKSATWEHLNNLPVGQFYAIGVDMRNSYRVYGGLQDNGSWGGPSATREPAGISMADWFNILGFDGYYCQIDPKDSDTVYAEGQYAILRRINVKTGDSKDIRPRLESKDDKIKDDKTKAKEDEPKKGKGKAPKPSETNIDPRPAKNHPAFRFNWSSPLLLSPHDAKTVYFGGNHLFRSFNRGDVWTIISPDLTRGKPGANDYAGNTITTIAESPKKKGLLYVGTDDGKVWVSRDGGRDWTDLSEKIPDLPQDRWITRVECSPFDEGTVFLSIDRHRNDDRAPHLFKSVDFGETWQAFVGNLPNNAPVHVIRTDPHNPSLLYVGTEIGLYLSVDGGKYWTRQPQFPTVPVHDLVVHPRDRELVIGTHGRGIYVMPVAPLQAMNGNVLHEEAYLFDIAPAHAHRPGFQRNLGIKQWSGENPTYGAGIYYYFRDSLKEPPDISITDGKGAVVGEAKGFKEAGLHRLTWRMNVKGTPDGSYRPVPAGTYTVTLTVGEKRLTKSVQVSSDE
ncbi:MAG: hypothetical protein HY040_13010 [Planctomycetes bacterium]|nr:hypothetical protein [Planctomycetota bacterium]